MNLFGKIHYPIWSKNGIDVYHGDCCEIIPSIGRFDLLMTDPPYELETLPSCLWDVAPVAYIFGDKRMVAEHWFRQVKYKNKDILAWYYKNSPKPKGRWRMSMQTIIYGWEDGIGFNEDAARIEYTPSAQKLNGRIRPSSGRLKTNSPYDTSKGALPRDVIEFPALLGHLSKERVGHKDQKPLGLVKRLIQTVPNVKTVIDPYGGSGTTAVAAIDLKLRAIVIEKDKKNCDMIISRLEVISNG